MITKCLAWFKYNLVFILLMLCVNLQAVNAQPFFQIENQRKHVTIPFSLVRDMVIVKVRINGNGPYNFVLDSGVGLMIITDPKLIDSLNVQTKRLINITGLDQKQVYQAYVTTGLNVAMPGVSCSNISAAIFTKDHFGLSNYAGMPVHGLLGYEFFSSFAVKVNFEDSTLTIGQPKNIRLFKRGTKLALSVEDHKPYINTSVLAGDGKQSYNKLIVDLGAGHPISLENLLRQNNTPAEKRIPSNLGMGITGPINGYLSRISEVDLGKYKLKNVIASFPDSVDRRIDALTVKRDGNLGMEILKKFNLIIDYQSGAIYLKSNIFFGQPFEHDMSGMEYYATGDNLKHILINRVEQGSPADAIGLIKGDEITAIDFKPVKDMTIADIDNIFKSRNDRYLILEIFHDNVYDKVVMKLKRRI